MSRQMSSSRATYRAGVVFALLGAAFFSLKAIFVKLAYRYGVDAETLLALRMAYALPCFAVMAWYCERKQTQCLHGRDWFVLGMLGVLGYYLASYLDFLGLRYISAALERLTLFLYPTLVLLLSALFLGKPIPKRAWLPLAMCYAGIVLAVSQDMQGGKLGSQVVLGSTLVFASALSYALYLVWSGEVIQRLGAARVSAWASCVACLLAIIQFLLMRPVRSLIQVPAVHGWALAMAMVSTVMPIWLVAEAMRRIGAGRSAMIGSIGPVLTIFFGWLVLGEHLGLMQGLGGALVMLGVWQVTRSKAH